MSEWRCGGVYPEDFRGILLLYDVCVCVCAEQMCVSDIRSVFVCRMWGWSEHLRGQRRLNWITSKITPSCNPSPLWIIHQNIGPRVFTENLEQKLLGWQKNNQQTDLRNQTWLLKVVTCRTSCCWNSYFRHIFPLEVWSPPDWGPDRFLVHT